MNIIPWMASISLLMVLLGVYTIVYQQQYTVSNYLVTAIFASMFVFSAIGFKIRRKTDTKPVGN